jgi:hypothetical protein
MLYASPPSHRPLSLLPLFLLPLSLSPLLFLKVFRRLRPWERVQSIKLFLEPFSVPNGLLTQTLKVRTVTNLTVMHDLLKLIRYYFSLNNVECLS